MLSSFMLSLSNNLQLLCSKLIIWPTRLNNQDCWWHLSFFINIVFMVNGDRVLYPNHIYFQNNNLHLLLRWHPTLPQIYFSILSNCLIQGQPAHLCFFSEHTFPPANRADLSANADEHVADANSRSRPFHPLVQT